MKRACLVLALIVLLLPGFPGRVFARQENPTPSPAAPPAGPAILAPKTGEMLQGIVAITAQAGGETFQSAEIAFAYANDTTGTWFLIHERAQPLAPDTAIEWDTSLITDGDYKLRMLVIYTDGSQQTAEVAGLRVRNYTAVETDAPAPAPTLAATAPAAALEKVTPAAQATPAPTQAQPASPTPEPSPTALPAPTPLPRNPAALPSGMVWLSLARGILAAFGAFALIGLYELARRIGRK